MSVVLEGNKNQSGFDISMILKLYGAIESAGKNH